MRCVHRTDPDVVSPPTAVGLSTLLDRLPVSRPEKTARWRVHAVCAPYRSRRLGRGSSPQWPVCVRVRIYEVTDPLLYRVCVREDPLRTLNPTP
jgi:hypothetical protein